jgi:hypothetical protein
MQNGARFAPSGMGFSGVRGDPEGADLARNLL